MATPDQPACYRQGGRDVAARITIRDRPHKQESALFHDLTVPCMLTATSSPQAARAEHGCLEPLTWSEKSREEARLGGFRVVFEQRMAVTVYNWLRQEQIDRGEISGSSTDDRAA